LTTKQVTWNGSNDPANPKNWSFGRKWAATAIVSLFSFLSPLSSSMIAPALPALDAEFKITNAVESQIMLSIFVLAYAIGPLFLGPLSEVYGRSLVIQGSNIFYLVFNTACGASKTRVQMTVFRFLAGVGGSAPLSVSCGVPWSLLTLLEVADKVVGRWWCPWRSLRKQRPRAGGRPL
jgi:MFS family permease